MTDARLAAWLESAPMLDVIEPGQRGGKDRSAREKKAWLGIA